MATFLDIGMLKNLVPLFGLLFVFFILFGLLQKTKLLGGKQLIDFFVSLIISILVLLTDSATELINFMSVWLAVVMIILVVLIIMFSIWLKEGETGLPIAGIKGILFWVFIIILIIGLTNVFGPIFTPYAAGSSESWVTLRTLFHPRVIGAVVLLLIIVNLIKVFKKD